MKIQICSDLHFEFLKRHQRTKLMDSFTGDADVLVLAGDICPLRFIDQVRDIFGPFCEKYKHVVYVPGNHEYYHNDISSATLVLGAVENELSNLHVLKNSLLMLDGQRFFGGTLWFKELPGNGTIKDQINDFDLIADFQPWVYEQNAEFIKWAPIFIDDNTIVVSHHLPSYKSVPTRFADPYPDMLSLNRFFVTNLSEIILKHQPRYWFHGHIHDSCNYSIGRTHVICNPKGYPNEMASGLFNPNLFVEV